MAFKCNRCKQFKDGTPHAVLQQRKVGNPGILTKQVCEDCALRLLILSLTAAILSNCSAPFTAEGTDYAGQGNTAGTASQAGSASGGSSGSLDGPTGGAFGGMAAQSAGSGGIPSNGGDSSTAGAGGDCLSGWQSAQCATVCTYHPESGCVQVLSCIVEKGVTPPKTLLDPCPGTGYEDTRLATLAYQACCN